MVFRQVVYNAVKDMLTRKLKGITILDREPNWRHWASENFPVLVLIPDRISLILCINLDDVEYRFRMVLMHRVIAEKEGDAREEILKLADQVAQAVHGAQFAVTIDDTGYLLRGYIENEDYEYYPVPKSDYVYVGANIEYLVRFVSS